MIGVSRTDLRLASRALIKHSTFTSVAVLSLGLAIGLNTTMYSMLDALVNPNVAMRAPERLYLIRFFGDYRHQLNAEARNALLRSDTRDFEALTGMWRGYQNALIEYGASHQTGTVALVASNYFSVLGVRPRAGRLFSEADLGVTPRPTIISERLARGLFPGDASPIGERVKVNGDTYVVIGVLDRTSDFPQSSTRVWILPAPGVRQASLALNLARVRPGITSQQLRADLSVLAGRIASQVGESPRDNRIATGLALLRQLHVGRFDYALIGAVIAVLLVACASIANLQLARGVGRRRELATRAALGASRGDIVKQLVLESAIVSVAGLVLGLILAFGGMHLIRAAIPTTVGEYIVEPQTSWRLFAFAAAITIVCILLVGLAPAIRVSRVDLNSLLKHSVGDGSSRSARRQYGMLIAAEIGFALVVVCWAALLHRAARQYRDDAAGWDSSMLSVAMMHPDSSTGQDVPFAHAAADLVARMREGPDVADAAVAVSRRDDDDQISITTPGGGTDTVPAPLWSYQTVTTSYVRTMGFTIAQGRDFKDGESGAVVIVDSVLAARLWPHANPIGQMMKFGSLYHTGRWYRVIGVRNAVGVQGYHLILADRVENVAYIPAGGDSRMASDYATIELVVRARDRAYRLPVFMHHELDVDKRFTVLFISSFDQWTGNAAQRANRNFVATLFDAFAVLVIALAAFGVYSIVAYSVAERRREIAVLRALGASSRSILYTVLREGMPFVLSGLAIGLLLIRKGAGLVRPFLLFPEIDMYSVELYIPAAIFLVAVAIIAALIPAIRATRIDPAESLHCD